MRQRDTVIAGAAHAATGVYFWALLGASVIALSSLYAALIFASATWADTQALNRIYPDEGMCIRSFSAASWRYAQQFMMGGSFLALLSWLGLGPITRYGRQEFAEVGDELRHLLRRSCQLWQALTSGQRRFFVVHLVGLTCVRLYLSWTLLWHDDGASYDLFVQNGLLAVTTYYPVPNNHLLSNLLAWSFSQVYPGFWWSMRLPVLLTSTIGTVLLFGVMLRRLGYWPALLAAGAISWLQPSLYQAANGRGYWAMLLLTGAIFWAMLAVLEQPRLGTQVRLPWVVLVGAGVLGCYALPVFVYVVVSAWSWMGLVALCRNQWQLGGKVLASGALLSIGTGLIYAPLLFVSGPSALSDNAYVRPLSVAEFWHGLPAYMWFTEGFLGGQFHIGALLLLGALTIFGWAAWQAQRNQLPTCLLLQVRQVGWPALWFSVLPYVLITWQRVLPPERVLLYKAWFGFLLLALGIAVGCWPRLPRWLLYMGAVIFALYQVVALLGDNRRHWLLITHQRSEYNWLAQHAQIFFPPGRVVPPCRQAATPGSTNR